MIGKAQDHCLRQVSNFERCGYMYVDILHLACPVNVALYHSPRALPPPPRDAPSAPASFPSSPFSSRRWFAALYPWPSLLLLSYFVTGWCIFQYLVKYAGNMTVSGADGFYLTCHPSCHHRNQPERTPNGRTQQTAARRGPPDRSHLTVPSHPSLLRVPCTMMVPSYLVDHDRSAR